MTGKSQAAIRMAAKACLIRYFASDSPSTTLDAYFGQLAAIGWGEEEIAQVAEKVHESLDMIGSADRLLAGRCGAGEYATIGG